MTPEYQSALIRAGIGGFVSGAVVLLTTAQTSHNWEIAGIAGGLAFFLYVAQRGWAEGWIDTRAAAAGRLNRG